MGFSNVLSCLHLDYAYWARNHRISAMHTSQSIITGYMTSVCLTDGVVNSCHWLGGVATVKFYFYLCDELNCEEIVKVSKETACFSPSFYPLILTPTDDSCFTQLLLWVFAK